MFHERGEVVNPQEVAKVAQSAGKVSKKVLFYGALGGASLMWIIDHPREPPPYWKTKPSSTPSPTPPYHSRSYDGSKDANRSHVKQFLRDTSFDFRRGLPDQSTPQRRSFSADEMRTYFA
ncbi:unnamed protein product [Tilletia controversa]|uniref:Uncharacterized protein n=1 Tax=Tilletia controversa TaxID=13291 RepID=A0A8X7SSF4_9BASI|nr:hypothetical protein CF328_g8744 [Tilletia controversa]KAE8237398.1 hypothetical protein A4X06_0g9242 [Tilletia controversa]CAD6967493.1 unnamed protein product [Tilletia controversa]